MVVRSGYKPISPRQINRSGNSRSASLPVPNKGLNSRDNIANLKPEYASKLINWFPTTSDLMVRNGYKEYSLDITGQVNSLMGYNGLSKKMFAVAGDIIYDATASGSATVSYTPVASDKFISQNITTSGGTFLVAVNGVDDLLLYDGTTWTPINGASTPAITGVTTANLSYVTLAKRRLWFVEKSTTKAWYLDVNSIGGVAKSLDLGASFIKGGYLKAISSWSITGGFGTQDLTVFLSTEGDIVVYQGDDPDTASDWKIAGIYNLGSPIGHMPFCRLGTDLLVLTQQGLSALSQGQFFADTARAKTALTDNIAPDINRDTTSYALNYGWQTIAYPNENMLLLNIPVAVGQQKQYVMNTITGAWAEFNQIYANCFLLFDEVMYFGGAGKTFTFWQNTTDNSAVINAEVITSFNQFGTPAEKAFKLARLTLSTYSTNQVNVGIELNYKITNQLSTPTLPNTGDGIWDEATWDSNVWAGEDFISDWFDIDGMGFAGALHIKVACREPFRWANTQYIYQVGNTF